MVLCDFLIKLKFVFFCVNVSIKVGGDLLVVDAKCFHFCPMGPLAIDVFRITVCSGMRTVNDFGIKCKICGAFLTWRQVRAYPQLAIVKHIWEHFMSWVTVFFFLYLLCVKVTARNCLGPVKLHFFIIKAIESYARILMDRSTRVIGLSEVDGDCVSELRHDLRWVTAIVVAWRVLLILWLIVLAM